MPLGTEVGLIPDDIVLDGDPAPPCPERGRAEHCTRNFVAKASAFAEIMQNNGYYAV